MAFDTSASHPALPFAHGHDHAHAIGRDHDHDHGTERGHGGARSSGLGPGGVEAPHEARRHLGALPRRRFSLFLASALDRACIALVLSVMLWMGVFWAMH